MSTSTTRHRASRLAAALSAAGLALLAVAAPASAHVRVKPDSTASGSYSALTFRVPNESPTASTTKVVVTLPLDRPMTSLSVRPVPGWTAAVAQGPLPQPLVRDGVTITKAPHTVTWTATPGSAIAPGQYQEFAVVVGPLPDPGALVLPATQTYSDGTVVRWDQGPTGGASEPEHPAPQFTVTQAQGNGHGHGHDDSASKAPTTHTADGSGASDTDATSRWLAGGALLLAAAAVALQLLRGRRGTSTDGRKA